MGDRIDQSAAMMRRPDEVRTLAKILWDYHNVPQELPAFVDLILVAGSHDDRVAVRGAELTRSMNPRSVVTSGGLGKVTKHTLTEPEGARFKRIMQENGVSGDRIISEERASNTGENIINTRELLTYRKIETSTGLIVTKPYMKRRALATATKQWPEVSWWAAAPEIPFDQYPSDEVPETRTVELMVGDLQQRMQVYADLGYQTPQDIPEPVWHAYHRLVDLGFDRYVLAPPAQSPAELTDRTPQG